MNTKQKLISLAGTMVVAALLAGAAVSAVAAACSLGACAPQAYLCALGGAALCALIAFSPRTAIPAALAAVIGVGAYIAMNISGGSISLFIDALRQTRAGATAEVFAGCAGFMAGAAAAILSIFVFILISDRGRFTSILAVVICLGAAIICSAASGSMSLVQLFPAAMGACLALSHSVEQRQSGGGTVSTADFKTHFFKYSCNTVPFFGSRSKGKVNYT